MDDRLFDEWEQIEVLMKVAESGEEAGSICPFKGEFEAWE